MELLLIRHGLPIRRELETGVADPELSEAGHAQAQHLAEYLSSERLDAVYASPLRRAYQTAQPLAASQGHEIVVVDDVAEWDRNSSEYVPVEELRAANDPRWQAMLKGEWNVHEESPQEFRARVVAAVEQLIDAHSGHRIAIVCHGGVINGYLSHILGLNEEENGFQQGFFYPNYTSIHRVAAARSGERSIVTVNETSHLRSTGLPMGLFQGT
jgi:probable phosphoglycerate mutase